MSTNRRTVIKQLAAGAGALGAAALLPMDISAKKREKTVKLKGNINHSVCRWCLGSLSVEELCQSVKKIGFNAIDLVGPKDWPTLQKHGVYSSMCNGAEINLVDGFAEPKFHNRLVKQYTEMIPLVAKNGYKSLICFSGNRRGMDDETGINQSVEGLKKVIGIAEKHGVILQMELLNSKIDHKDYFAGRSAIGVEICKRLGSENFKLLYDIYHMQIDEGDVIRTIRDNHQYFGHYHTAGVPGRREIFENQELNYPAIVRAIAATGFKGYLAQEFIPTAQDNAGKLKAIADAVALCDV